MVPQAWQIRLCGLKNTRNNERCCAFVWSLVGESTAGVLGRARPNSAYHTSPAGPRESPEGAGAS
jgi:hypothetical protein